jgi:hypothetical protein
MLSDHDRRTLAEIERHLQDDSGLYRAFERRAQAASRTRASRTRRAWFAILLVSLVLMVGVAALGASGAAVECAALAATIGAGLRFVAEKPDRRIGRGQIPNRRS